MKISFMSFSCVELDLREMLELARRLGYDGIEPRAGSKHAHGVETSSSQEDRKRFRAQAEETGIAIACVATSCRYADPGTTQENIEETLAFIDLAADVGAQCIRVFGGTIGGGLDRKAAIAHVARALRSVAARADERGVFVCMETHDDWCDPAHVAEVMRDVDHPNIAVNWDIMHPVRVAGCTIDEAYEQLKEKVRHVHFHDGVTEDGKLILKPIGEGDVDHCRAVQLLKADGYEGFLSGEWIGWEPYEIHLPRELAKMREYESRPAS